ncbi:MAG: ABC transporter ATP-binding protein [Lactobacillaceae bacterium]|jgi:teichoic acid transport system ATP-binding protein|nr:ABC transporter ATP-binding protein [Lactobacillaceae bacterium]
MDQNAENYQDPYHQIALPEQLALEGNVNVDNKPVKLSARYITKEYDMGTSRGDKINAILNPIKSNDKKFWALKGLSFDVFEGDVVGVIGVNGSGKSTLLNILSRALIETTGTLDINGETSLLAVYDGLRENLTGLENIRLKSLMMGATNKEVDKTIDAIAEFSELGEFIKQPVKKYSSGMRAKLGFAIAVHQDPDILIIDEALSVGDATFQKKALNKVREFKEAGKTMFFVSHSLGQVKEFTDKVMWIQHGELRAYGDTQTVTAEYEAWGKWYATLSDADKKAYSNERKESQVEFNREQLAVQIEADPKLDADAKKAALIGNEIGAPLTWFTWIILILFGLVWIYTYYIHGLMGQ